MTNWMLKQVKEWEREESTASGSEIQNLSLEIKASEERMDKLVSTYLDGDIPKTIYLTNTLSKQKETFEPITPGSVSMYHCGPTVYWTQHIGNMRAMTIDRKSVV